jgi:hypothetical protein
MDALLLTRKTMELRRSHLTDPDVRLSPKERPPKVKGEQMIHAATILFSLTPNQQADFSFSKRWPGNG